jgi:two-component system nitrate/nitrite response regulator NarL
VPQPLSRAIRVFVAESSPISSQLLAAAIARDSGIDLLGFSSSPLDVLRIVRLSCLDVLLVSSRMEEEPNRGIVLLQQLRAEHPGLKAVVLLDSRKAELVVQAFRSGAAGVFCRNMAVRFLRKCITAVHNGQIWANSEELGFVLSALTTQVPYQLDSKRLVPLSAREKEVVRCLVEGLTNREIAESLAISQHTVKNYVFKIYEKLGVSNRVELVFQVLSGQSEGNTAWVNSHQEMKRMVPVSPEPVHESQRH